jgi:serine/threonine-protein phosphatase 2A activator
MMESLGSGSRLDYGTGHELSFLAFLYIGECLNFWNPAPTSPSSSSASSPNSQNTCFLILGLFRSYLRLTRLLIQMYRLEPAGSHGVWGLDDHHFLPYIFGAAQLIGKIVSLF